MGFSEMATDGIRKIYEHDFETQRHFLEVFCENVRKVKVETLLELKCFFVPNNEYLVPYFGEGIFDWQNDIYHDGHCKWNNQLVIPLFDVGGDCAAFVGFDFLTKLEDIERGEKNGPYYSVSSQTVFSSRKYLFFPGDSFARAFEEGYIVVVDGMFDAINLYTNGINASMLGSAVTWEKMMQLQFIPRVFVAMDNDRAGRKLLEGIRRFRRDVRTISQNVAKDADDVLSGKCAAEYLAGIRKAIGGNLPFSLRTKPEFKELTDI